MKLHRPRGSRGVGQKAGQQVHQQSARRPLLAFKTSTEKRRHGCATHAHRDSTKPWDFNGRKISGNGTHLRIGSAVFCGWTRLEPPSNQHEPKRFAALMGDSAPRERHNFKKPGPVTLRWVLLWRVPQFLMAWLLPSCSTRCNPIRKGGHSKMIQPLYLRLLDQWAVRMSKNLGKTPFYRNSTDSLICLVTSSIRTFKAKTWALVLQSGQGHPGAQLRLRHIQWQGW